MATSSQRGRIERDPADFGKQVITPAAVSTEIAKQLRDLTIVDDDEDEDDGPEETSVDRIIATLRNDDVRASVKVYRRAAVTGKLEFCHVFTPAEYEAGDGESLIASMFGPGSYEIRVYATNPATGKFAVRTRVEVNIAKMTPIAANTMPSAQNGNSELAQVLAVIAQGQQQIQEALLNRPQPAPVDPMAQMAQMLALMTSMREAMGITNAAPTQKSTIGEIVEAIKELQGVQTLIGGAEKEESETDKLLGLAAPIMEMVKTSQQQAPQQMQQQMPMVALPPGYAANPATHAEVESHEYVPREGEAPEEQPAQNSAPTFDIDFEDPDMLQLLALRAALLKMCKNRPANIDDAANELLDRMPEDMQPMLRDPEWFNNLAKFVPDVKPHQEWLTLVRNAAVEMLDEGDEEPEAIAQTDSQT